MGRVKVTEKPGWPYVLVNDFKSPPYFAYEAVDAEGNKSFVRVLKGAPEEHSHKPTHPDNIMLTDYKTKKIMQFLKETLKTPLKYGEFMGKEWMEQLVKVLGLLNSHIMEVASKIVERWLETGCFQKLIQQIRKNEEDAREKARVELAKEKARTSSSSKKAVQKRQDAKKDETRDSDDSSSDESLFTPIKAVRNDSSSEESLFTPIKAVRNDSSSDESMFTPVKVVRKKKRLESEIEAMSIDE